MHIVLFFKQLSIQTTAFEQFSVTLVFSAQKNLLFQNIFCRCPKNSDFAQIFETWGFIVRPQVLKLY